VELIGFFLVAAVVIVTPGQDTALTIRNTLVGARRAGVATAAGVSAGQAVWTLVFCAMTFVWLSAYAAAVAKAGDVLRRPSIRRVLDAVVGVVLVGLGLRLATERR